MKIRVYAPAFLNFESIDLNGYVELQEGSKLKDVLKKLNVPFAMRPLLLVSINYTTAKLNTELKDDDIVSIFFPISGG